jgi:CPA2 family monovalent cation:H+ antiporter-2
MAVTLQFGLLFFVVALLTVVTQPFAPHIPGIAVIFAAALVLVSAIWRTSKNLQGHAVAGGEVIVAALTRRLAEGKQSDVQDAMQRMHTLLPGLGEPVALTVAAGSIADGQTLAELDMRGVSGATVLALLRGNEHVVSPRGDLRLQGGDTIAVAGTHDAVDSVRSMVAPRTASSDT